MQKLTYIAQWSKEGFPPPPDRHFLDFVESAQI